MEVVATVRWVSFIKRQDIKLDLINATVAAKKRMEDLAMLIVDRSGMDNDIKVSCAE
jgi:hypothetical protein